MKSSPLSALCALGLLGAGYVAAPTSQDAAELAKQLGALSAKVDAADQRVAQMSIEHQALRSDLDAVVSFLEGSSKRAEELLGALQRSEDLGFTSGINFESREELLAGFREYLNNSRTAVKTLTEPVAPGQDDAESTPAR